MSVLRMYYVHMYIRTLYRTYTGRLGVGSGEFGAGVLGRGEAGAGDSGERPRNQEWIQVALKVAGSMNKPTLDLINYNGMTALMLAAAHGTAG